MGAEAERMGRSERYRFGGWNAPNDESGPGCPWRFAGQWEDEESGLYYNRFRYYDSEAVQYLTPDPIGLTGNKQLLVCTESIKIY